MEEVIINDRRVKFEDGEIWSYIKYGRSLNYKWRLIKGCKNSAGYHNMTINNKIFGKHRVMYKIHNPDWDMTDICSLNYIDHIDRNPLNNNIENLRCVSQTQNCYNKDSKGYYWHKASKKWLAQIRYGTGLQKYLGIFEVEEDARNAYLDAKLIYHIIE